ncbi:hypothetical protein [Paenibacillus sp. HJGM_3]|uniref:hypothetical protein n=1 Tax=Paenibacillus sp. HJGM_3 TaxID=3379816 RepID=UPI00385B1148
MEIYKAKAEVHKLIKQCKEEAYHACKQYLNRYVRLERTNGAVHEGYIVHVDADYVYLHLPQQQTRYFNPYYPGYGNYFYNSTVLPLVLFDLLAITLLL